MGCAICDQGSVQLCWDGKFSVCFLISETSFADTPSALYLSNLSWKPSITVTKINKSPFKEWRAAWPVWGESWGRIAEGWEERKDAPDTCVVLRPTWGMTLDRYNIEPLLSCHLPSRWLCKWRHKGIQIDIGNYCVPFLLFQTFVLSGTLINASSTFTAICFLLMNPNNS